MSPLLTVVAIAVGPALFVISLASRNKLFPASWDAQQHAANVAGVVDGAVTGVRVVKGFGQEEQEVERLEWAGRLLYAARVRAVRLMAKYNPTLQAIPALGQVGVLALGGWLAIHGDINLGTFFAFSSYIAQLVGPVRSLTGLITLGQEARASVIRVFEVIDSRPVLTEKPGAARLPAGASDVELDDVRFGYLPSEPVLRGLSLRVQPGETVAVVGTSGSGKSTISLLLPRFYDVTGGAIRIGGHDVRDVTLDSLRAAIGLVLEDSFLFSDTISANIAYGTAGRHRRAGHRRRAGRRGRGVHPQPARGLRHRDRRAGADPVRRAAAAGRAGQGADHRPRDPRPRRRDLGVDPSVEAQIHETLRRVMAGRTTMLIAHRRSTLQLANKIAVLDDGRLVDLGTHEELTERCPLYRLLLAGPGDDAEGVDAGELAYYENAPADGQAPTEACARRERAGARSPHRCGRPAAPPCGDAANGRHRNGQADGSAQALAGPGRTPAHRSGQRRDRARHRIERRREPGQGHGGREQGRRR